MTKHVYCSKKWYMMFIHDLTHPEVPTHICRHFTVYLNWHFHGNRIGYCHHQTLVPLPLPPHPYMGIQERILLWTQNGHTWRLNLQHCGYSHTHQWPSHSLSSTCSAVKQARMCIEADGRHFNICYSSESQVYKIMCNH